MASALIKSMRGSDVDAALHYLARMLEAGEDPRFIARRIVISASEDVGMADPTALQTAVAAMHAVAQIGMPEARIILAQAVVHNALAPKSNAAYTGINEAIADVRAGQGGRCPPTCAEAGMPVPERLGHGAGYVYAHDEPRRRRPAAVPSRRPGRRGPTTTGPRGAGSRNGSRPVSSGSRDGWGAGRPQVREGTSAPHVRAVHVCSGECFGADAVRQAFLHGHTGG